MEGGDPLLDEKCHNCELFPICNGGCPYKRLENVFANEKYDTCHIAKGRIKEFLKLYYEYKKKTVAINT